MRWSKVCIESVGYELPEERISTSALEASLAPVYAHLKLGKGQIEALTGIRERRYWPVGQPMFEVAARAGQKALDQAGLAATELGVLIYAGVCRDNLEPATACAAAELLGIEGDCEVYDISNACLGVLNGMIDIAHRIERGEIRAGMVISAESSRHINQTTRDALLANPTLENFRLSLATFTGGSGAVAVVLTREDLSYSGRRLLGGAVKTAPHSHRLCRWGGTTGLLGETPNVMLTDASAVLTHGVALGRKTWDAMLGVLHWQVEDVDRVVCHQVGSGHRKSILESLGVDLSRDFSTFEFLGNMGTVAVPMTLALADEQGFISSGDRVGLLGIGSGLNCIMLGIQW